MTDNSTKRGASLRKPPWLKMQIGHGAAFNTVQRIVRQGRLHTVCDEALCPNKGRCWQNGRATIMILGDTCTRGCAFCGVKGTCDGTVDREEPVRVADAVRDMELRDVVITSVTRDDLPDGGAALWHETIKRIKERQPGIRVEVLVPDFAGDRDALRLVLAAGPDVCGHNLETVEPFYARVRPEADYHRSLNLLRQAHASGVVTKTSIMLGLGETEAQILQTMRDARSTGAEIFYMGQYLQPSRDHLDVERYVPPEEFDHYRAAGLAMGFGVVVSAPLVRSSFHSDEQVAYLSQRTVTRVTTGTPT